MTIRINTKYIEREMLCHYDDSHISRCYKKLAEDTKIQERTLMNNIRNKHFNIDVITEVAFVLKLM